MRRLSSAWGDPTGRAPCTDPGGRRARCRGSQDPLAWAGAASGRATLTAPGPAATWNLALVGRSLCRAVPADPQGPGPDRGCQAGAMGRAPPLPGPRSGACGLPASSPHGLGSGPEPPRMCGEGLSQEPSVPGSDVPPPETAVPSLPSTCHPQVHLRCQARGSCPDVVTSAIEIQTEDK